ncbi:helix-turn-helix transcriptional regulator [Candidatus Woesearchaeota archaeon]|jgi:transcriptional regulator with XRE-family HTH domain|nr:helix-turn-helix transcriptional regulator [Candidatus Thioglobus sp.]MBT4730872.1 helix-turn-helix transcriptional regulator [Candidatus Woesearchaeota archaeon]MBT7555792.1 helix-turn-helix transcriptional regulator [Candidatus Woesearchaeota archaeon]
MKKAIYSSEVKILCAWLKEKRELSNLTMRDLAKLLDTSHATIGKIELGERRLDVIEWIQYCEALDASPFECLETLVKK